MAPPIFMAETDTLRRVELEGLTLLFHARSGMTHIVAPPAPQIMDVLAQGPADGATLLRRLREIFDFDDQEGGTAVNARLAELESAGLVRRA